jgi:hypothetical protein
MFLFWNNLNYWKIIRIVDQNNLNCCENNLNCHKNTRRLKNRAKLQLHSKTGTLDQLSLVFLSRHNTIKYN